MQITDAKGNSIRWLEGSKQKGLHRISWDLRLPSPEAIDLVVPDFIPPWAGESKGPLATPGEYTVKLFVLDKGTLTEKGEAQTFTVKPLETGASGTDFNTVTTFQQKTAELYRQLIVASNKIGEASESLRYMQAALMKTPAASQALFQKINDLEDKLNTLRVSLYGDRVRQSMNESTSPSMMSRVGGVISGHWDTRQNPTETQKHNIDLAEGDFKTFQTDLKSYLTDLESFGEELEKAGAPWTPGRKMR